MNVIIIRAMTLLALMAMSEVKGQDRSHAAADATLTKGMNIVLRDFVRREEALVSHAHFAPRHYETQRPSITSQAAESAGRDQADRDSRPPLDPVNQALLVAAILQPRQRPRPQVYEPSPPRPITIPAPPPVPVLIGGGSVVDRMHLDGAMVFSIDRVSGRQTYLGRITDGFYHDSIFNEFGVHGSAYGAESVWNKYGRFGDFSDEGALNQYAFNPPFIMKRNQVIGRLTVNRFVAGAINPHYLRALFQ